MAQTGVGAAEPSSFRSVRDVQPRIPDELDRPVNRVTSSHRGWEIREDQYTIAANTSLADAEWAAAQVGRARTEMAALADRFTQVHRAADFGLNSLQVAIEGEPPRERDAPPTTLNVVGIQTQVLLNVSPGQPRLAQQRLRLRQAAAFSLLHAAELDAALPAWVVLGLAGHVARVGEPDSVPLPGEFAPVGVALGGEQWRFARTAADRLAAPPEDLDRSALAVEYLLTGDDAVHAAALLAAIQATNRAQRGQAARRINSPPGNQNVGIDEPRSALARLARQAEREIPAWRKDPLRGQPEFEPESDADPALVAAEREMLVVLKLVRRLTTAAPSSAVAKREGQSSAPRAGSRFDELLLQLAKGSLPVLSTLDANGQLLLSTDRQRMQTLLGWDGQKYRAARQIPSKANAVDLGPTLPQLETRLPSGPLLIGWLADDPKRPLRPRATFEVVASRSSLADRRGGDAPAAGAATSTPSAP
jgi:YD repeat-containing protein